MSVLFEKRIKNIFLEILSVLITIQTQITVLFLFQ